MDILKNQECPICHKKTLNLSQEERSIPHFGVVLLFSMTCDNCKYHKADVECVEVKEPCKYTFIIENKKDLDVKVVKSSSATVKIPQLRMDVKPGPASEGYISNMEGVLTRFKKIIESERDSSEDQEVKKHARNLLKKLWKVELGEFPLKVVIEDPKGNSAILSEKAVKERLK
jgi:zinc finger protein